MQIKDIFRLHRKQSDLSLTTLVFDTIDKIDGTEFNPANYDFNEFGGECAYSFLGVDKF